MAHAVSSSGSVIDSTLEIARHGSYASTATFHTRRNGIRYYESQGFFLIDGGLLFVETNSSVTNASLPNTNRLQIIRITDEELVFKSEEPLPPGTTPDPEQIVFHRQRK